MSTNKVQLTQDEMDSYIAELSKEEEIKDLQTQFKYMLFTAQDVDEDAATRTGAILAYLAIKAATDSFEDKFKALYEIVEEGE